MRDHSLNRVATALVVLTMVVGLADQLPAAEADRLNVLLICIDDLKPALGCYGDKLARSPNIDRLAARGLVCERAYCNQAVCAPSRNSLLTGLRPQTLGIYDLGTNFRKAVPDAVTLPQYFQKHGYRTSALGKIFHVGHGNHEDPPSWSVPHWKSEVIAYALPQSRAAAGLTREEALFSNRSAAGLPRGAAYESADVPDNAYPDGAMADEAILRLQAAAEKPSEPFFLALGFVKPHLPFCAPQKYWDLHDPAKLPLAERKSPPEGAPPYAPQFGGELRQYAGIPERGPLADDLQRKLIHGYYAAVSYMDAQLGRVLDELDRLKLDERTIVVLWGDHGWHLGDHGIWCKHTNYEQATRIPLIVVAPGVTRPGSRTASLVETVDLYPTLCELAGLPAPREPRELDGQSFAAALRDPQAATKQAIFHVYPRNPKEKGPLIGRAVRTARHRLVEWKPPGGRNEQAEYELYDYETDAAETRNIAADQPEIKARLQANLASQPEAKPQIRPVAAAAPATDKPNIVLFLADDLSWSDCSIYGQSGIRTPNMQRLAADGKTFTHAFVASPSCAPSRAALLTGLNPARNGAMFNHTLPDAAHPRWPAHFRELGYEVVAFGKVAHYATVKQYGFDQASHFNYHQDDCIQAAVKWLGERRSQRPLCLLVGTNWPHVPWPEKTDYAADAVQLPPTQVDTAETRQWRARYAAAVSAADRDLGLVYDAVQKHLGENTLFLFTSDHGSQFPFGKWNCYDQGIRTPLVASWPGKIKPGTRTSAMVSWIDLLPTCLAAAGGEPPASGTGKGQIDGQSFLPVLKGEKTEHRDRIFTTHSGDGRMNEYPIRSVRARDWKYIRNLRPQAEHHTHVDKAQGEDGKGYWSSWVNKAKSDPAAAAIVRRYHTRPAEELYDLTADPWELHNLAAEPAHAERLAALRGELDAWMQAQGDEGLATEKARQPTPRPRPQAGMAAVPNIVVVLVDDFGCGDLSCYGGMTPTPQIDKLAAEGTRFTQYYTASPICSPSRAGLLTGQFPARWQITSYLQSRKGNRECEQADFLDPKAPSLPRMLQSAGYATAHIGKWHLGGGRDVDAAPKFAAYGYDLGLGTWESPEPHPDITATDWIWSDKDPVPRWERTRWMVDQTLKFLDDHGERPCFVNLWLDDTHTPWVPGEDQLDGPRARRGNSQPNLRRVLSELDKQIGRLRSELADRAAKRPTLVLLVGDNGPLPTFGQSRTAELRGSKLSLYEGGIRVPCIAWWPGQTPKGKVNDDTVLAAVDFLPTLCSIAGAKLPADYASDGEDLSSALRGEVPVRTETLYWEYGRNDTSFAYPQDPQQRSPNVAMREGRWKLLVQADGSKAQLFDVLADQKESSDLAALRPDLVERLSKDALAWRRSLPAKEAEAVPQSP